MALLDTSVIIRYLTGDNEEYTEKAANIIESDQTLHVTPVVIVETGYVLTKLYKIPRTAAVDAIIAFIQLPNIEIINMDKSEVYEALLLCRPSNKVSLGDAFIWSAAKRYNDKVIYTFDRGFPQDGTELREQI